MGKMIDVATAAGQLGVNVQRMRFLCQDEQNFSPVRCRRPFLQQAAILKFGRFDRDERAAQAQMMSNIPHRDGPLLAKMTNALQDCVLDSTEVDARRDPISDCAMQRRKREEFVNKLPIDMI